MAVESAGGFEYRGRAYRFQTASCRWEASQLFVEAEGDRCWLSLVGVPFREVSSIAELPGRVWEPDEEEISIHADTFAEGGVRVREKDLWIMGGRIECKRYDNDREVLTVSFRLFVQQETYGREDEVDGVAYCEVE